MKRLFDDISLACGRQITMHYSTSFSLAIKLLGREKRNAIYAIYGFVRLADEIVDSFHDYDKRELLNDLEKELNNALELGISINPILNGFQSVVHQYKISKEWIDHFIYSMRMDLDKLEYNEDNYSRYLLGSSEVVGLMCLHVFCNGDREKFDYLKPYAMSLGSAFQKVNFLRDLKHDNESLGRTYFPNINIQKFSRTEKKTIEEDIEKDFTEALIGIKRLPIDSRAAVYLAYSYYHSLYRKIKKVPPETILNERIRIPDWQKIGIMCRSIAQSKLNLL